MADYWVSQPRKFCEICKCWYADNKISVDHHERGVRHKANVANHLREARKKNTEERKEQESVTRELIRIELEAQRAYEKDVLEEQLSSAITDPEVKKALKRIQQQKSYKNLEKSVTVSAKPQSNPEPPPQPEKKGGKKSSKTGPSQPTLPTEINTDYAATNAEIMLAYYKQNPPTATENKSLWWQLSTPEGIPYYYNTVTGVTQWEKPDMLQGENTSEQTTSGSGEQSNSLSAGESDQVSAGAKRSSNDDSNDDSGVKRPYSGRGYHRGAYGGWTVVAEREQVPFEEEDAMEEKQDIATHQESESSESDSEADKAEDTEMKEMFKEKTVDSLEDTVVKEEKIEPGTFGGFSFKKRNMNFKKPQIRQRINESDY